LRPVKYLGRVGQGRMSALGVWRLLSPLTALYVLNLLLT
jgi:hypothetical protein